MRSTIRAWGSGIALAVFLAAGSTGCASMSDTERGAIIGAATGAAVGGAVGKAAGSTTKGVIIGAVVGGAAGAVIGREMDQRAEELEGDLEGAEVERVGEGILVTFDSGILFAFDSSELRPESRSNLRELYETLVDYPETDILIAGHTDAVGEEEYNYRLSERRARSAAEYLMSLGMDASRINLVGLGETEPVATNETAEGRQENRRVEIAIYASEEYRQEVRNRVGN